MPADAAVQGTLYHLPATPPRGQEILPLRQMRTRFPDLYERHSRKYASRPGALEQRVEPLDCFWADVVFLSPLHPAPLFAALRQAAVSGQPQAPRPWTLDARRLDPARAVIRLMRHGHDGHHADPPDEHDYLPFTTAGLRAVNRVTLAAVQRLATLQPGDPWLPWADVPHVLYRGSIPVSWFRRPSAAQASAQTSALPTAKPAGLPRSAAATEPSRPSPGRSRRQGAPRTPGPRGGSPCSGSAVPRSPRRRSRGRL